jgi:uncharacterized protein (TIGR00106 family)
MNVIVDAAIIPLGVGLSLSKYVAECEKIFKSAGLKTTLHANGTNIEGDWDEVMAAVKKCHEHLHQIGVQRISTNIRIGTRTDCEQTMEDKIKSVQLKLDPENII